MATPRYWSLVGSVLLYGLVGGWAACSGPPASPKSTAPEPVVRRDPPPETPAPPRTVRGPLGIEVFECAGAVYAFLEVEGVPYAEMGDEIDRVARLLAEQGIEATGFSRTVYLDDPRGADTAQYRYRVGFPVAETALPRLPLRRVVQEGRLMARVRHKGDYDESYQVRHYEEIPAALRKMGYTIEGPVMEIYCYPVVERDPRNWVTELWYPVRKAPPTGPAGRS